MQQHPVPQPITNYEFRLVGDMTIKQFGKLSGFLILALIVYAINPPITFIKWFFVILFASLGFLVAFVPFQGRPIDAWIIAFFKRIYSPTQFIYKSKTEPQINTVTSLKPKDKPPVSTPVSQPAAAPSVSSINSGRASASYQFETKDKKTVTFNLPPVFPPKRGPGEKAVEAKFAPGIIIPAAPSYPNIIVGFIHDANKKIVDGAILEIRESNGNPVRALKSNRLGQFQIATPLPNGDYEIEVEKEGYTFNFIKIKLEGKIIPPVEIISRS